jgi:hypothetical protein
MPSLTPEGLRAVGDIATRHGFSLEAASSLLDALVRGQGGQAQFDHPELGGMGQWSRGGMIMIGDMFNSQLKFRIDGLCNELSDLIGREPGIQASAAQSQSQSQGGGYSLFLSGGASWWPAELGQPSSSGAQNDMRYAFFPGRRRLAIQQGTRVQIYDSGDHQFSGFSQQQGGGQSLTFNSQHGTVRVSDLRLVEAAGEAPAAAPPSPAPHEGGHSPPPPAPPPPRAAPAGPSGAHGVDEVLKTIKALAALRQDGVLTDEEFAAKKAELLSRI